MTNKQVIVVAAAGSMSALAVIFCYYYRTHRKRAWRAPFAEDARRPRQPLELDREKRNSRIKRLFKESEIPSPLDAIVIGSGIGGLSVGAILAKTGRRVLVLEQHGKAGGCCHTFSKDDTEWDVGLHYAGEMDPEKDLTGFLLNQLSQGQLGWSRLTDDCYDTVVLEDERTKKLVKIAIICNESDKFTKSLILRFPNDEAGIREFFRMVKDATKGMDYFGILKIFPIWLCNFLVKMRFFVPGLAKFVYYFHELTLKSALDKLFPKNKQLKAILEYCWGCVGACPEELAFGIGATLFEHFSKGAYYPIGGASEIAYSLIPTIEGAGGRVLMKARVKEILLSENKTAAIGVRVEFGKSKQVEIKAPLIISDAGISNTFLRLLPAQVSEKTTLGRLLRNGRLKPSMAIFEIFVGLTGSQQELALPTCNFFVSYGNSVKDLERWFGLSLDEAVQSRIPYLFFDFPSAKDPSYADRYPGRSVCTISMFVPVRWFKPWSREPKGKRSSDYAAFKMGLAEQAWEQVVELYPGIVDRRRFMEAGSPITVEHYLNAMNGEAYGLDHGRDRFSPELMTTLRSQVREIENLYLTGQDVVSGGFAGALMGGFICASSILASTGEATHLFGDLERLKARLDRRKNC